MGLIKKCTIHSISPTEEPGVFDVKYKISDSTQIVNGYNTIDGHAPGAYKKEQKLLIAGDQAIVIKDLLAICFAFVLIAAMIVGFIITPIVGAIVVCVGILSIQLWNIIILRKERNSILKDSKSIQVDGVIVGYRTKTEKRTKFIKGRQDSINYRVTCYYPVAEYEFNGSTYTAILSLDNAHDKQGSHVQLYLNDDMTIAYDDAHEEDLSIMIVQKIRAIVAICVITIIFGLLLI